MLLRSLKMSTSRRLEGISNKHDYACNTGTLLKWQCCKNFDPFYKRKLYLEGGGGHINEHLTKFLVFMKLFAKNMSAMITLTPMVNLFNFSKNL